MRTPRHFVISTLLLGGALLFPGPFRRVSFSILRAPFTLVKTAVTIVATLPRLPSLQRENAALRVELSRQQLELARLTETLRRSTSADILAGLRSTPQGVVAAVIGRSMVPTQQTALLNRGARQGIALSGMVVTAAGVVGRVVEVHAHTALVILLTDPTSRIAAMVERSRETGLLAGTEMGRCELLYLSADSDVVPGDRVVTAGLGGPFPKGLLLGTIARVTVDAQTGSARAVVTPAARLGQLEDVVCFPPSNSP